VFYLNILINLNNNNYNIVDLLITRSLLFFHIKHPKNISIYKTADPHKYKYLLSQALVGLNILTLCNPFGSTKGHGVNVSDYM